MVAFCEKTAYYKIKEMFNSLLIIVAIVVGAVVTLSGLGYNTNQIKSFLVDKLKISTESATLIVGDGPTATPSAIVIQDPKAILEKYNLIRFKNTKWTGNIIDRVNGSIPAFMGHVAVSMNYVFEIDELAIDFQNLDWAKQAKAIGVTNTNKDGIAISIVGKGKIRYQNPWQTYVGSTTKAIIETNPLPVSFVGYIDPKNKKLLFNEAFTNKPILTATEYCCLPEPIGCIPPTTKSKELIASELWLRGMIYEIGDNNELVMKEPIWDLRNKDQTQKMLEAQLRRKGNVKVEASGSLKIKN